jgi:phenylalanyl-tRNA synthetase alpha chain
MLGKIDQITKDIQSITLKTREEAETFRLRYLSKKGVIADLFADFKTVPPDQKKQLGQRINELKNLAHEKIAAFHASDDIKSSDHEFMDLTRPGEPRPLGSRHPISIVRKEILDIFSRVGFVISEGPEIEDDWHDFGALNFPYDHPARDMQDTFFIRMNPDILLRTHTSSVQVRVMEKQQPPIRTISPGRVFRNEAISARAHCIFHQVEGLYIDKNVSFADLRQVLFYFSREMFGKETQIRLRPSFFPFTEPSAEMDISCSICGGRGCNVCKHTGWLEIMGCGMVDPSVLDNCNIDSVMYTGYAFGMGIERIAMLKYQINDLRLFFENDKRFLEQFRAAY